MFPELGSKHLLPQGKERKRSTSTATLALHSKGGFFASAWGLEQTLAKEELRHKCSQSGLVSYLHCRILHNGGQMGELGFV